MTRPGYVECRPVLRNHKANTLAMAAYLQGKSDVRLGLEDRASSGRYPAAYEADYREGREDGASIRPITKTPLVFNVFPAGGAL